MNNAYKQIYAVLTVALTIALCSVASASDTTYHLVPQPEKAVFYKGSFTVSEATTICYNDESDSVTANYLAGYFDKFYGLKLKKAKQIPEKNYIQLVTKKFVSKPENDEHYTLAATADKVIITGDSYSANFLAANTLIQLLQANQSGHLLIPVCEIDDRPKFPYRGMHLDVARHFFDTSFIKKFIDLLALHKFNRFHWHLTDDQGWRIEIKKYPLLTTVGAYRNGTITGRYPGTGNTNRRYGGYYTQEQIKDIVAYASQRHIMVIPEIDMPGHASAAIAAYPYLSCFPSESTPVPFGSIWKGDSTGKQVQQTWGVFEDVFCTGKDATYQFLEDVLAEVTELFPSEYIHIGGDECPKQHWKRCPECQAKIKKEGLTGENELQSYFMMHMEAFLRKKNRKSIGWDEMLEGKNMQGFTVMNWRGDKFAMQAAHQKLDVIRTPESHFYLDFSQSKNDDSVTRGRYVPVEAIFHFNPFPPELKDENKRFIVGVQGNVWTEYMPTPSKVEYQILPRMSAISEVAWGHTNGYSQFKQKLPWLLHKYKFWKLNYSMAAYEITDSVYTVNDPLPAVKIILKNSGSFKLSLGDKAIHSFPYTVKISAPKTLKAFALAPDTVARYNKTIFFNKATAKKITGTPPAAYYSGENGLSGLVNGIRAHQFNSTEWLGWYGKDVSLNIDLLKKEKISNIHLYVWRQEASFIYLPSAIEIEISNDGKRWTKYVVNAQQNGWEDNKNISFNLPKPSVAKFVRVKLISYGKVPAGRPSAGSNTWLFLSEIAIN